MSKAGPAPFAILEWDSSFFGKRIARVDDGAYSREQLAEAVAAAREQQLDCLYFLVDPQASGASQAAQLAGFRLIDVRITMAGPARRSQALAQDIRPAVPSEQARLAEIARHSFHDSRFYCDPRFDRAKCDDLYATWIERSLDGSLADAVLVADRGSGAAGYITCRKLPDGTGSIGLLAVAQAERGRGHASQLLDAALDWFAARDVTGVSVVTQGRNAAAQRTYQRQGFLATEAKLWYHCWPAYD